MKMFDVKFLVVFLTLNYIVVCERLKDYSEYAMTVSVPLDTFPKLTKVHTALRKPNVTML